MKTNNTKKHYFVLSYIEDGLTCYLSQDSKELDKADIFNNESAFIITDKFRETCKAKEAYYRSMHNYIFADRCHQFWTTLKDSQD